MRAAWVRGANDERSHRGEKGDITDIGKVENDNQCPLCSFDGGRPAADACQLGLREASASAVVLACILGAYLYFRG